jgi:hypothetical protein
MLVNYKRIVWGDGKEQGKLANISNIVAARMCCNDMRNAFDDYICVGIVQVPDRGAEFGHECKESAYLLQYLYGDCFGTMSKGRSRLPIKCCPFCGEKIELVAVTNAVRFEYKVTEQVTHTIHRDIDVTEPETCRGVAISND